MMKDGVTTAETLEPPDGLNDFDFQAKQARKRTYGN